MPETRAKPVRTRVGRVLSLAPARPWFPPGSMAGVRAVFAPGPSGEATARLELTDVDRVVAAMEQRVRLSVRGGERRFAIRLPEASRRGYGLRLTLRSPGRPTDVAISQVEALEGWWESPRHACLTDFRAGVDPSPAIDRLADWHVSVVQFYDWMFRHYRYLPPRRSAFIDPLGRSISLEIVRAAVHACHRRGLAALAYGSVYGAEREYIDRHPDELLRDDAGRPLSLGEKFFITDLRPGSSWRSRLLREYERACRRIGFDGIHMDQYGHPHQGVASDGTRVDLGRLYPALIAEADAIVRRTDPGRRVLFNAVSAWPLGLVASAPSAATYVEVWPPDVRYADLVSVIDRARRVGPGKAIVVAAYLSALHEAGRDPAQRPSAIEALLLLTSVIVAAGAYHHVLAERDRLLVEGYYPAALPLRRPEAERLRAAWTFSARYVHLLSDPGARDLPIEGFALADDDGELPVSEGPVAGQVWARATELPDGRRVLQLVDLLAQANDRWDALRQPVRPVSGWRISWPNPHGRAVFLSPWSAQGQPIGLRPQLGEGAADTLVLPRFRRWAMILEQPHLP